MAPANLMTEKDKVDRKQAFAEFWGSTHVPYECHFRRVHEAKIRCETGRPCPLDTGIPRAPRKATDEVLRLAGVVAY